MSPQDQQKILAIGRDKGTPLLGNGPLSDNYLKFLVKELKPYIDTHFSTLRDQKNTFTAGSSMGGLISMYAICEYPGVFGEAACLSTHWPGIFTTVDNPIPAAFIRYLKTHLPSPQNHRIYFDYGSATLDAMYKPYQLQADSAMKMAGYAENNWLTREFPGADHSEISWRKRFDVPVLFLLGKQK
ncbi:MAG TPA: alpha/beta hydrolase-fold protein [Mucilaginibacter sp.]|nr:alpha/beta hydrolase-fold protein [Mucilaginibacter sp.]